MVGANDPAMEPGDDPDMPDDMDGLVRLVLDLNAKLGAQQFAIGALFTQLLTISPAAGSAALNVLRGCSAAPIAAPVALQLEALAAEWQRVLDAPVG